MNALKNDRSISNQIHIVAICAYSTLAVLLLYVGWGVLNQSTVSLSDLPGVAILKALQNLVIVGIVYFTVLGVVIAKLGAIHLLSGTLGLIPTVSASGNIFRIVNNESLWIVYLVLLLTAVNLCVFVIWRLLPLAAIPKSFILALAFYLLYVGVGAVTDSWAQSKVEQRRLASIGSELYFPSEDGGFSYESFDYYLAERIPYFSLTFEEGFAVALYAKTAGFNPPKDCGSNPTHLPESKTCEQIGITPSGSEIWKHVGYFKQSEYTEDVFEEVEYFSAFDNTVMYFHEGVSGMTDQQAVDFISSFKPITLDELMDRDPTSARRLREHPGWTGY